MAVLYRNNPSAFPPGFPYSLIPTLEPGFGQEKQGPALIMPPCESRYSMPKHESAMFESASKFPSQNGQHFYNTQYSPQFTVINNCSLHFSDIRGQDEILKELLEIKDDVLFFFELFNQFKAKTPLGILLTGPSGVGKTIIGKAFAGELNIPLIYVSGNALVQEYAGVSIRELFAFAGTFNRSIVFIDDIDGFGGVRSSSSYSHSSLILEEFIAEFDNYSPSNTLVLATSNAYKELDPTVPGRFHSILQLNSPNLKGRADILAANLKGLKHLTPSPAISLN